MPILIMTGSYVASSQAKSAVCSPTPMRSVYAKAAARLLNGAALNAALWVAASEEPQLTLPKAIKAFRLLATGLLAGRS